MTAATQSQSQTHPGKAQRVTGWILTGFTGIFLAFDGATKLFPNQFTDQAMAKLGYPATQTFGIGILVLACALIYLIPRTAVLGAVLLTGYLGGAVASQVRIQEAPFSIAFPIIIAAIAWTGLYLREERLHSLLPIRS
jgi:hypothetical protein